jgi:hypothetical protein
MKGRGDTLEHEIALFVFTGPRQAILLRTYYEMCCGDARSNRRELERSCLVQRWSLESLRCYVVVYAAMM